VLVTSEAGELKGTCAIMPMKGRNIQVHWPEGNVLLRRGATDPVCGIPDYTTTVSIVPLPRVGNGRERGKGHETR
jgi:hypothetical protein